MKFIQVISLATVALAVPAPAPEPDMLHYAEILSDLENRGLLDGIKQLLGGSLTASNGGVPQGTTTTTTSTTPDTGSVFQGLPSDFSGKISTLSTSLAAIISNIRLLTIRPTATAMNTINSNNQALVADITARIQDTLKSNADVLTQLSSTINTTLTPVIGSLSSQNMKLTSADGDKITAALTPVQGLFKSVKGSSGSLQSLLQPALDTASQQNANTLRTSLTQIVTPLTSLTTLAGKATSDFKTAFNLNSLGPFFQTLVGTI